MVNMAPRQHEPLRRDCDHDASPPQFVTETEFHRLLALHHLVAIHHLFVKVT